MSAGRNLQRLKSAITELSYDIPQLTIIKEAYLSHEFDDIVFLTAYSKVTTNDKSAEILRQFFKSLSDVLETLDQASFSTLNRFLNKNDLAGHRELLIEAFKVGPLLLLLLKFPQLQFLERQSKGTKPTTYMREYYDAFPLFSNQQETEAEDLVEFSNIYKGYVKRVKANYDTLQYLVDLAADLFWCFQLALPLFNTRHRGAHASSGMGPVIVQDSTSLFQFITIVASLLLSEGVLKLGLDDNTGKVATETLQTVEYTPGGVYSDHGFADLSGIGFTTTLKADGLACGAFNAKKIIFFPVEIKEAIGLKSLPNFPYIINEEITTENTYSCIQQLIRCIITSQTGTEGFLVFLSENSTQILELEINLDKIPIDRTDAKFQITLGDKKRKKMKLKSTSNHTEATDEAEVEEKILPVFVKLHRIYHRKNDKTPPPVMTFQIKTICMLASRLQKWNIVDFPHDMSRILDALQTALLRVPGKSTTGAENDEGDGDPEEQRLPKKSSKKKGGKRLGTVRGPSFTCQETPASRPRTAVSQDTPASRTRTAASQNKPASRNQSAVSQKFSLSLDVWFLNDSPLFYSPTVFVKEGISALRQTLASMGLEFISNLSFDFMEDYRASVLVIERESLSNYMVDTGGPDVDFKKFLDATHGKVDDYFKSSKLIIKVYNEWLLQNIFDESEDLQYHYKTFDSLLSSCYKMHQREIQCLEKIAEFNDRQVEERDRIMAPRVYLRGDKFNLTYGITRKQGAYGRYFVSNYIQADEDLNHIIPLREEVIVDAKLQISNMTEKVGIVHGDLSIRNMIFSGGRINFIDYGISSILSDAQKRNKKWLRKISLQCQDEVGELLSRSAV